MKSVDLYTDGACSGNPGKGGFGAVLLYRGVERRVSGYFEQTTNNRMEIFAVIAGLRELKVECVGTIYSGSGDEVKNQDLWRLLLIELEKHQYRFVKVKGHADNAYNNLCDQLATGEIAKHS